MGTHCRRFAPHDKCAGLCDGGDAQLTGGGASNKERAPGDVRLGRSMAAIMIWE
jgi:hypothetical protein